MADQNILVGDINVLARVRSDVKEYEGNRDRLHSLSQSVGGLSKNLEALQASIRSEIETTVKKRRDDVAGGFNNAIDIDKEKIKQVQSERDKAKNKGIKERIAIETEGLAAENDSFNTQILEAFRLESIPKFCKNDVFMALFVTKGARDILICIAVFAVLFCLIPFCVNMALPDLSKITLGIVYLCIACAVFFIYKCMNDVLFVPHAETMTGVRATKKKISVNNRKIRKIRRSIKKDTNEEMYGLESFDKSLNELYADIERIEGERAAALKEFDDSTMQDIVAEIEGRDKDKIAKMKSDIEEKNSALSRLQDRVKQQQMYISSNYEAYLGSEFVTASRLDALYDIMRSTNVKTIGQALMVFNERK